MPKLSKGLFVSFEGGEGTGKSTQIKKLEGRLRKEGFDSVVVREPGSTSFGESIRNLLKTQTTEKKISKTSELFLFSASRKELVESIIKPTLKAKKIVLCDRFTDSTIVYQSKIGGVDRISVDQVNQLSTGGLFPNITFLLDLDPEASMNRSIQRNEKKNSENPLRKTSSLDFFDTQGLDFYKKIRKSYKELEKEDPQRIHLIDASENETIITEKIWNQMKKIFNDFLLRKST